ncbi:branched-chain amino acid ABC transporter permease [Actinoplanes sp. L3-i22]|uniref:branched-chain amino acid ABC transporter permease n=1 Tax=Actinoplanes sp. L3-i22 TaxID=2836373 RepID=UPI001C75EF6A|nr:branched-chain amino acid ABC transporter permease [Actinoplanes sp. L3-i22]BCY14901.1 branched-chain amino acid ABC transporter permease [Actinoplanes sp. L3-i22]
MTDIKEKRPAITPEQTTSKPRKRPHPIWYAIAGAVLIAALTYYLPPFRNYQLATVGAYFTVTAGLTVLTGLNGQLSLGHGALMATGAYTFALTQNRWLTMPLSFLAAVLATVLAGAVIGLAAARLRGPYLAGLTLAVAVVVPSVASTFDDTLGSDMGLSIALDPPPGVIPMERWQAWLCWAGALLTALLLALLVRGRFGRDLRAVRDDETAARLAGVHIARTQILAFVVSAACAGLAGALFAFLAQSVSPGAFPLTLSLFLVMAIVIGGLGRLFGALLGALLLVLLPALAQSVAEGSGSQHLEGNLALVIFGVVLVVVMLAAPGGLASIRFTSIRRKR